MQFETIVCQEVVQSFSAEKSSETKYQPSVFIKTSTVAVAKNTNVSFQTSR